MSESGSKPMSFAATASMATWSALARKRFLTWGRMERGPGPSPAKVPSMTAKMPGWISFWIISRSTSVSWMTECVQWRRKFEQPAERVLHRAGRCREDMGLDGRQVDDVLADEDLGYLEAVGEDFVQDQHLALGLVVDPDGVLIGEVEALEAVPVEDGLVLVLDFALM